MTSKAASLFLLFGLDVAIALGAESVDLTRDEILDHIRGGWTGMLIGGMANQWGTKIQGKQKVSPFYNNVAFLQFLSIARRGLRL